MEMELCYSTTFLEREQREGDLLRGLEIIKESGVNKVELSRHQHNFSRYAEQIRALGIEVWSVHGHFDFRCDLDDSENLKQAVERETARMKDVAAFAPCPYVIHYLARYNDPKATDRFRHAIELLAEANRDIGLILAVETVPYKPEINERYADSKEVADFVRSFHDPHIQNTIDINHSNLREDLADAARNCRGQIANIHVSDNHGVREEHLPPGSGVIDLKAAMAAVIENGYRGPCNLELHFPEPITCDLLKSINARVNALLL